MSDAGDRLHPSGEALAEPARCLNCEAALNGRFCAECGQRAMSPRPTMRELVGEAWQEFVNVDGKVATTLRLLVTSPGRLTVEALAGRRARYVGPLRLYVLCSLAFFATSAVVSDFTHADERAVARATAEARARGTAEPPSCSSTARGVQRFFDRIDCKLERDPARTRASMRASLPRGFFALLPVFAVLLALAFRRHAFIEHVYVALHLHAFIFLVMLVPELADLTATPLDDEWTGRLAYVTVVLYGVVTLRRVYRRGWASTVLRATAVGGAYVVAFFITLVAAFATLALTM